jgi:hypothetical protein
VLVSVALVVSVALAGWLRQVTFEFGADAAR